MGIGVIAILFIICIGTGKADTIIVDQTGEGDHLLIQDALDNANDGDIIEVREGVYFEHLIIDKKVSIRGAGQDKTIINGSKTGDVMRIQADGVLVKDLAVTASGDYFPDYGAGIRVEGDDCQIMQVTSSYNTYGIEVVGGDNGMYTLNTFILNYRDGVSCGDSRDHRFINNTVSNNGNAGYNIFNSSNIAVSLNTCQQNYRYGILLRECFRATLSMNDIQEGDIHISSDNLLHWNTHTIDSSNLVNGRSVRYYRNMTGRTVPIDTGQVIFANCTNMHVKNLAFAGVNTAVLVGFSANITIENITCGYSWYGILTSYSTGCIITNNVMYFNREAGICISHSTKNIISGNILHANGATFYTTTNTGQGIFLGNSDENVIENNICNYTAGIGIYAQGSSDNVFMDNDCSDNSGEGIMLTMDSDGNSITYCILEDNIHHGIKIADGSDDNVISENNISGNYNGIMIEGSSDNFITKCSIYENTQGIYVGDGSENTRVNLNSIWDNTDMGLDASKNLNIEVDAARNWWGADTGPVNVIWNPSGTGNGVSGNIGIKPWLDNEGNEVFDEVKPKEIVVPEVEEETNYSIPMGILIFLIAIIWVTHEFPDPEEK